MIALACSGLPCALRIRLHVASPMAGWLVSGATGDAAGLQDDDCSASDGLCEECMDQRRVHGPMSQSHTAVTLIWLRSTARAQMLHLYVVLLKVLRRYDQ
jgi:hypothetical protein